MTTLDYLLSRAAKHAIRYRSELADKPAKPLADYHSMRDRLNAPLPLTGSDPAEVLDQLVALAEPGLMPTTGPKFFAWVMGGSDPIGVAADFLVSAWGQNAGYQSTSPSAAAIEEVAERWLLELLDLPHTSGIGFTTGATVANGICLAAARTKTLMAVGWDPDADGLFGAPPIHVLIGKDAHSSVYSSLQLIGLGRKRVISVDTDELGRMIPAALDRAIAPLGGPKIIIAQAGQINTGAFDPFDQIVDIGRQHDAWVHVDGAFGLWARATSTHKHLTHGIDRGDSWATDGHKWLQAPYDCGFAIVRDRDALLGAMSQWSSYLPSIAEGDRIPSNYVPELSRRARGIPVYAILKTLGRQGVARLVERHCSLAARFAERLSAEPGIHVISKPIINQLIVSFGDGDSSTRRVQTEAVISHAVTEGTCYVAGAMWRDDWVMRISVTSGATTEEDIDLSADAVIDAWRKVAQRP